MHVLRNVKGTMLTIAKDAHKHVAAVLKNVEGWLGNKSSHSNFLMLLGFIISRLVLLLRPSPFRQKCWVF
jgi:hypothetical protein